MPALTLSIPVPVTRRIPEINELKGLAILLVVLDHAGGVLSWDNRPHGDLGVDIFVILSGVGFSLGSTYPGFLPFMRRRLGRIMPAYWVMLTAAILLNTYFLQLDYSATNIVLHYLGIHGWCGDAYAMSICDSFWFITLILSLYLLYAGLRRFLPSPEKLLLAGGVISVLTAFALFFTGQSGTFGHLALRIRGFYVGLLLGQLLRTGRLELTLGPALGLAGFVLVYAPYTQGIAFHNVVAGLSLMGLYVFVLRAPLARPMPAVSRALAFLGDYSLEIFLLHQPLIREYNIYLHGRWLNEPLPTRPSLAMGMLLGFGLTLLVSIELRRLLKRFFPA